jgi:hypothetical protein
MGAPFPPEGTHLFIGRYGADPSASGTAVTFTDIVDKIYGRIVTLSHHMSGTSPVGYCVVEFSPDGLTWFAAPAPTISTVSGGGNPSSTAQSTDYFITYAPVAFSRIRVTLHATMGMHVVWLENVD